MEDMLHLLYDAVTGKVERVTDRGSKSKACQLRKQTKIMQMSIHDPSKDFVLESDDHSLGNSVLTVLFFRVVK